MGGRMSRSKGKRGERETVNEIKRAWPDTHPKRGWQAREGYDAPDVDGLRDFWIEVKTGKKPNIRAALQQAVEAEAAAFAKGGFARFPIAVIRDDREEPIVVLTWSNFLSIARPFVEGD